MRSLFIYYKVDLAQRDAALAAIRVALGEVEGATGASARLMCRVEDPATWMEVYENVADIGALERALDAVVRAHALERFMKAGTQRHAERFQPLG